MYISAKVDYAMRVLLALAAAPEGSPMKGEVLATAQGVPVKFVENTLVELRRAGIVNSQRGPEGGYRLARPADEIAVRDIIRALEAPPSPRCGASARRTWSTTGPLHTSSRSGWLCAPRSGSCSSR